MKTKVYIGHKLGFREIFRSSNTPTSAEFPQFAAVIGPFRTVRGANFMLKHGYGNPHCQTVSDAERLAKLN